MMKRPANTERAVGDRKAFIFYRKWTWFCVRKCHPERAIGESKDLRSAGPILPPANARTNRLSRPDRL